MISQFYSRSSLG